LARFPSPLIKPDALISSVRLSGRVLIRPTQAFGSREKYLKQIIAELTPVLRGWGNYFRTGNAHRELNKMDFFVVKSLRRWQFRRGGQRPAKRHPFTSDQLYGMGLHRLMGTVQ